MKTTQDSCQESREKFAWWCYAIWWFDALVLLVIMIAMSARHVCQERRKPYSGTKVSGEHDHGLAGLRAAV